MHKYTLGFIFSPSLNHVLLIKKKNPPWQRGKFNGVGGSVEKGETALNCMMREAKEESDLYIEKEKWRHVGRLTSFNWVVEIFVCRYKGKMSDSKSLEEEQIKWMSIQNLPQRSVDHIQWLIPLVRDIIKNDQIKFFSVKY